MELATLSQTQRACRLIAKGLRPEASGAKDTEYAQLITLWEADPEFRQVVHDHARVLDLIVMEVTALQIVLRPSGPESAFRRPISKILPTQGEKRGLQALALVAVAAAYFRTGRDLTDRTEGIPLTLEHIEDILTELCERLREQAEGRDGLAEDGQAEGWRLFLSLARQAEGEVRGGWGSRTAILRQVIGLLVDQSMLRVQEAGTSRSFVPTERFRLQLRDVITNEVYTDCVALLGIGAGQSGESHNA
jgi:hypothetical protein